MDRAILEVELRGCHGGFVCRGDDVEDFSRRLITLLDDANLRRAFGSYNRRLIEERYRWPLAAARVHAIYDDVLARRRSAVAY